MEGIVGAYSDYHVIRHHLRRQELEDAVLGRLGGGDVARNSFQRGAKGSARLPEYPPALAECRSPIDVSFGFYVFQKVAVAAGEACSCLCLGQTKQINHKSVARPLDKFPTAH